MAMVSLHDAAREELLDDGGEGVGEDARGSHPRRVVERLGMDDDSRRDPHEDELRHGEERDEAEAGDAVNLEVVGEVLRAEAEVGERERGVLVDDEAEDHAEHLEDDREGGRLERPSVVVPECVAEDREAQVDDAREEHERRLAAQMLEALLLGDVRARDDEVRAPVGLLDKRARDEQHVARAVRRRERAAAQIADALVVDRLQEHLVELVVLRRGVGGEVLPEGLAHVGADAHDAARGVVGIDDRAARAQRDGAAGHVGEYAVAVGAGGRGQGVHAEPPRCRCSCHSATTGRRSSAGYPSSAATSPRRLSKLTPRISKSGCSRVMTMASRTKSPANAVAS